ncbi:MAG: restriction endonuclease subunit S [Polyangiaceae bacterium]|nr:restriction endonuclease subunit S [Polyangiaceae bacterium]
MLPEQPRELSRRPASRRALGARRLQALAGHRALHDNREADDEHGSSRGRPIRQAGLPAPPLPEQRQIAAILDTLDDAIRKTEQIIAKLKQVKQGLLHDLLTRGIDDNGELRDPERHPEQFKDSALGRIPKGWEVSHLATVAEVRSGIAKNSNRAVRGAVEVHYLRVANVQDGFLDLTDMATIPVGRDDLEHYAVLPGDVLMNEGGDLDKLGRGSIWRENFRPASTRTMCSWCDRDQR